MNILLTANLRVIHFLIECRHEALRRTLIRIGKSVKGALLVLLSFFLLLLDFS